MLPPKRKEVLLPCATQLPDVVQPRSPAVQLVRLHSDVPLLEGLLIFVQVQVGLVMRLHRFPDGNPTSISLF